LNHHCSAQSDPVTGVVEQQSSRRHWFPTDKLPPDENWTNAGGLPHLGLVRSMAPLKPRQSFRIWDPPVETFPHLHDEQSPSHADRLVDGWWRISPLPWHRSDLRIRPLGCCSGSDTRRYATLRAWQQQKGHGNSGRSWQPCTSCCIGCTSSQPDQGPSLNTPLQPWDPAVGSPCVFCWRAPVIGPKGSLLWIHRMCIQLCRGLARLSLHQWRPAARYRCRNQTFSPPRQHGINPARREWLVTPRTCQLVQCR
jgi:hypothetical protein